MGIDPETGAVYLDDSIDLVGQVRLRGPHGMTAEIAARLLFGADKPTRSEIEKARYRLGKKTAEGVLYRRDGSPGGGKEREPATWFLAAGNQNDPGGEQSENQSKTNQTAPAPQQSETGGDVSPRFSDCSWPDGSNGQAENR